MKVVENRVREEVKLYKTFHCDFSCLRTETMKMTTNDSRKHFEIKEKVVFLCRRDMNFLFILPISYTFIFCFI
jgi:hypothetical protein